MLKVSHFFLLLFQNTVRKAISTCTESMAELDVHRTKINRVIRVLGKHHVTDIRYFETIAKMH